MLYKLTMFVITHPIVNMWVVGLGVVVAFICIKMFQ